MLVISLFLYITVNKMMHHNLTNLIYILSHNLLNCSSFIYFKNPSNTMYQFQIHIFLRSGTLMFLEWFIYMTAQEDKRHWARSHAHAEFIQNILIYAHIHARCFIYMLHNTYTHSSSSIWSHMSQPHNLRDVVSFAVPEQGQTGSGLLEGWLIGRWARQHDRWC